MSNTTNRFSPEVEARAGADGFRSREPLPENSGYDEKRVLGAFLGAFREIALIEACDFRYLR